MSRKVKAEKIDLVTIDNARIADICRLYFYWQKLNSGIKSYVSRGINFPETLSEPMACYAMTIATGKEYKWNKGSGGDCVTEDGKLIEMKASSNFDSDLTSFGPKCKFDNLLFLRLDQETNQLHIYDMKMSADDLKKIKVNKTQTIGDQQQQGRRPHIRIINEIILPQKMDPVCIFDIVTQDVIVCLKDID